MTAAAAQWALALRLARRELRGGLAGFRVFLLCLTLGVAAIAAVGSVAAALMTGLSEQGRTLLGGDAELRLTHRAASAEERAWLDANGAVAEIAEMRAMVRAEASDERTLVELKSVDAAYPLIGALRVAPDQPAAHVFRKRDGVFGAAVEANVLQRLGLAIGDRVRLGVATFELRAAIAGEPDRVAGGFTLGPRVMISREGLDATGLLQPGSLVTFAYRVALPGADPSAQEVATFVAEAKRVFPDAGWEIRDRSGAAPGVRRFVQQVGLFLTLVGLTALLVGGVGVGNAVASYLDRKRAVIATFKCLGAPSSLIFRVYLLQILALAGLGVAAGLALGAGAPFAVMAVLGDALPAPEAAPFYPRPLLLAAAFGFLVAFVFALLPLARARDVSPARLFRDLVAEERDRPRPATLAILAAALGALALLAIGTSGSPVFAAFFVAGAAAVFLFLRVTAAALMRLAKAAGRPRHPDLRLALANLHRPGAPTAAVLLSLGLGLTLLVTVAQIEANLRTQVLRQIPDRAPTFFFIDVQRGQVEPFKALLAAFPSAGDVQVTPMLRGRIMAVDGVSAEQVSAKADPDARWALRGDRGITYSVGVPEGSTVVEGEWWPADYKGPPLVSFDQELARGLGVRLGSVMTLNVLGREVPVTVASLRRLDWSRAGMTFTLVVSPGVLEAAPHANLATARAAPADEEAIEKAVTDAFPNVSVVRVGQALETVNALLGQLAFAVQAVSLVTIGAGLLVLAGAIASGHRNRVYDAVVLKVLGATRGRVVRVYLIEFALIGLGAALVAAVAGTLAAAAVVMGAMNASFALDWTALGAVALAAIAATAVFGFVGTLRALSERPAPVLRTA